MLNLAGYCKLKSGNVWESNPLGALFKPPDGFEDHGQHQLCKHSRNRFLLTSIIVDHPGKYGFIKVIPSNIVAEKSRVLKCL